MQKIKPWIKSILLFGILIPFIASIGACVGEFIPGYISVTSQWGMIILLSLIIILNLLLRKHICRQTIWLLFGWLILAFAAAIVLMIYGNGGFETAVMRNFHIFTFPYFIMNVLLTLYSRIGVSVLYDLTGLFTGLVMAVLLCKDYRVSKKMMVIGAAVLLACSSVVGYGYARRPEKRYAGHGFEYMNGYSSTDFSDYYVYSAPSRLASLDHEPVLKISENYPVMDGAEACYPLYAAFAKAVYENIAEIELAERDTDARYDNGKYVSFTNTIMGFYRLLEGEVDLFFGASPSEEQMQEAKEMGVDLTVMPIGKEGFVFFVEADNPVSELSSEQIRGIYHGDITNWKEVGGKDQEIRAFQRPENSGSQTMMEYFMQDVSLKEPLQYERIDAMGGIIQNVAEYTSEAGAMGYTFRYFLEGLNQEKGVRMLSVDGVYPTRETIADGSYPLTVSLCLVTREHPDNENVQKMIDFILSEDGQELVEQTGYSRLAK